jgi:hypothetical protein
MQTIWKFVAGRLNNDPVVLEMPKDSIVIHAGFDSGTHQFAVWAIVLADLGPVREKRRFYFAGTAHNLSRGMQGDEAMNHINSFCVQPDASTNPGWFHAFEIVDAPEE